MYLEIGDKVSVLDDVLKGEVIAILNENEVTIKDSLGMHYNFHCNELIKIEIDQQKLSKYSDINNPLLKEKTKEKIKPKTHFVKKKRVRILEIDLHINQLLKSTKGMDSYDILSFQIETARRKLEYAIQKKISKVIFIHGLGTGVLKTELYFLFNKYPVKYYDAPYKNYGFGATEVYIFQNTEL